MKSWALTSKGSPFIYYPSGTRLISGILLFLIIFYFMRLYGIFLVDIESHEDWSSMAYDVLGANAVLLCPRVFSVLDNSLLLFAVIDRI